MIDFNVLVAQRVAAKSALASATAAREQAEALWTAATGAVSVPAPPGRAKRHPSTARPAQTPPKVVGHGDLNVLGQKYGNACRAEANAKAAYHLTLKTHNEAVIAAGG
jgi:hypothetical protein